MTCPRCFHDSGDAPASSAPVRCPACGLPVLRATFDAAPAPPPAAAGPALGGASSCYFHPDNAALAPCGDCSRYLCALCEVPVGGRTLCPACFDRLYNQNALPGFRASDPLYDSMALAAGWGWVLFYPAWLLAAPFVLYLAIAKAREPNRYLIPRRPWRYALALAGLVVPFFLIVVPLLIPFAARPR